MRKVDMPMLQRLITGLEFFEAEDDRVFRRELFPTVFGDNFTSGGLVFIGVED